MWQTQQYSGRKPHPQARIPRATANSPLSAAVLLLIKRLKFLVLLFRWETSKAAQELGSGSSGDEWECVTDWCFQMFLPECSASLTTFFSPFFLGGGRLRSLCLITDLTSGMNAHSLALQSAHLWLRVLSRGSFAVLCTLSSSQLEPSFTAACVNERNEHLESHLLLLSKTASVFTCSVNPL